MTIFNFYLNLRLKRWCAYILYTKHIHLLEVGSRRYRFLCDYLLYKKHLKRMDFSCTMVDILFLLMKGLNNHISHYQSSQSWRSIQPQCKKPVGCLANQVDIRKQLGELQHYSLLEYHKWFQDKDLCILYLYNALKRDSHYRLGIRLEYKYILISN